MSQFPALWGHGMHFHVAGGAKGITLWAIQCVLGIICLVIGVAALMNANMVRPVFDQIGSGPWFRYFTGFIAIAATLLLVSPMGVSCLGALLTMCVMAGIIIAQVLFTGGNPALPLIILLLAAVVAWERRPEFWAAEHKEETPKIEGTD